MHGFNRLGGNSLAETVVAGMIIGDKIAKYTKEASLEVSSNLVDDHVGDQRNRIQTLLSRGKAGEMCMNCAAKWSRF